MRIEKTPSGSYRAQVMIDGKKYSVTKKTELEVMKAVDSLKKGKKVADSGLTVKQAIENYINDKEAVLSPSTISGYKAMLRVRFPSIMSRKAASMTPRQWQIAVSDESMKVSAKTVKCAWGLVASSMRYNGIEVPQVNLPQVVRHEHEFLDPDQIPLFLESIKGKRVEIPALLALHGLRKSEFLAITWDKIDLEKKLITVSGALVKNADKQYVLKQTNKNRTSSRVVPIVIPRLLELLQSADKDKPVVTYRPSSIFTAVNDCCENAGLPKVGVHGLRHSAVSLAYSLGMNELTCMKLFGYADYDTMRKIYTHLAERDMANSIANMANFYSEKSEIKK